MLTLESAVGTELNASNLRGKTVEVAGGYRTYQSSANVLIPLGKSFQNNTHLEAQSAIMKRIISDWPLMDLSAIVREVLYPGYLKECEENKTQPKFTPEQLPLRTQGTVTALFGSRVFEPEPLYRCKISGITVSATPLQYKGGIALALSGFIPKEVMENFQICYNSALFSSIETDENQDQLQVLLTNSVENETDKVHTKLLLLLHRQQTLQIMINTFFLLLPV